jgi:hypothetical protein
MARDTRTQAQRSRDSRCCLALYEAPERRSILHLRVHSDTGGTELEGMPWDVSASPGADGDLYLSVYLADRAETYGVLRHLMGLQLHLVTAPLHAVPDTGPLGPDA